MANKYMKICLASLATRETQIKATVRHHSMPTRMTRIKRMNSHKYWRGCGETGTLVQHSWECKMPPSKKQSGKQPGSYSKGSTQRQHRPSNSTPRHLPTRSKYVHTKACTQMSTAALFTNSRKWKQPRGPSIDEQTTCYLALKGNEVLIHAARKQGLTQMNITY